MNVPFLIARIYFYSKKGNSAVHFISLASMLGVAIGTMALIIVLSVFAGLEEFILQGKKKIDPDLIIEPIRGKRILLDSSLAHKLEGLEKVSVVSPTIREKIFISFENKNHIAYIKGIDKEFAQVKNLGKNVYIGDSLSFKKDEVLVGIGIAQKLQIGDLSEKNYMTLYSPIPGRGQITNIYKAFRNREIEIAGIFGIDKQQDESMLFTPISFARELLNYDKKECSAIEINFFDDKNWSHTQKYLLDELGERFTIKDRKEQMASFYKMMNTENLAAYFVFFLILFVSTFSLAASIIMLILNKKQDLKTLSVLGLSLSEVKRIFVFEGLFVTGLGGLGGLLLGLAIILAQKQFELVKIQTIGLPIPYPVELTWENIAIVLITVLSLGVFCSFITAKAISKKFLNVNES